MYKYLGVLTSRNVRDIATEIAAGAKDVTAADVVSAVCDAVDRLGISEAEVVRELDVVREKGGPGHVAHTREMTLATLLERMAELDQIRFSSLPEDLRWFLAGGILKSCFAASPNTADIGALRSRAHFLGHLSRAADLDPNVLHALWFRMAETLTSRRRNRDVSLLLALHAIAAAATQFPEAFLPDQQSVPLLCAIDVLSDIVAASEDPQVRMLFERIARLCFWRPLSPEARLAAVCAELDEDDGLCDGLRDGFLALELLARHLGPATIRDRCPRDSVAGVVARAAAATVLGEGE